MLCPKCKGNKLTGGMTTPRNFMYYCLECGFTTAQEQKRIGDENMVNMAEGFKLSAEELEGTDKTFYVTAIPEIREQENDKEKYKIYDVPVKLSNGKCWSYQPNKTSRKAMCKLWGDDGETWVNKKGKIKVIEQNVMGEMKDVLFFDGEAT